MKIYFHFDLIANYNSSPPPLKLRGGVNSPPAFAKATARQATLSLKKRGGSPPLGRVITFS